MLSYAVFKAVKPDKDVHCRLNIVRRQLSSLYLKSKK